MIISASRRTDIPAFYTPWFLHRLQQGFVMVRNPFNPRQVRRVSLTVEDVDALVFWTRNAAPLLPHVADLHRWGYDFMVHYTITGYPRCVERAVPTAQQACETFARLSDHIGPERMVWRYDPILLGHGLQVADHLRMFAQLAQWLQGQTQRVVISFTDFYAKTRRNLQHVDGFEAWDIRTQPEQMGELLTGLVDTATTYGMQIQTCCEAPELHSMGLKLGACLDAAHLSGLFGLPASLPKDRGQRPLCGCVKSVDIGAYHSCLHGCAYCYATYDTARAKQNWQMHRVENEFLLAT